MHQDMNRHGFFFISQLSPKMKANAPSTFDHVIYFQEASYHARKLLKQHIMC